MLTRTGDSAQTMQLNSYVQGTQNKVRAAQTAIATGKAARTFAEISDDATVLLRTKEQTLLAKNFLAQNETLLDRLQAMDGAVANIAGIAEKMKSLLTQRLNESTGDQVPLGTEIDSALAEVAGQLNFRLGDRYLFAGSRTDTRPIQLPASVDTTADLAGIYKGDGQKLSARIDREVEFAYGTTAEELSGIFHVLASAKEAHVAGDRPGLEAAYDDLTTVIDELADRRGAFGSSMSKIESVMDGQRASLDYLEEIVRRIEDTDIAATFSRLAQDQVTLEAAYLTMSRLNNLTLADYLR